MFIIYLLFTLFFYIFTSIILNNNDNTLDDIKNKTIKQAEKIIINFFYNNINKNNNISLDDCILLFENSKHTNLIDFSES